MSTVRLEKIRLAERRGYATHFEWPDKPLKELGIVKEWLRSMESRGEAAYSNPTPFSDDPPDCVVFDRVGRKVAVEVTELVSRKAIEKNLKIERDPKKTWKDSIYRDWKPNDVIAEINRIIQEKDGKTFNGGPYAKKILVIHTDEFRLLIDREEVYERYLPSQSFGPVQHIDEAYLLFSYEPDVGYPYIQLPLNRL